MKYRKNFVSLSPENKIKKIMNTVSLNNLWTYIQGLTLTASNKKWLADHLYESAKAEERQPIREEILAEAARKRKEKEKALWTDMPKVNKEDLKIAPWLEELLKNVEPMPSDVDIEKIKYEHIMKKYG